MIPLAGADGIILLSEKPDNRPPDNELSGSINEVPSGLKRLRLVDGAESGSTFSARSVMGAAESVSMVGSGAGVFSTTGIAHTEGVEMGALL
jgi:hypothetical protein